MTLRDKRHTLQTGVSHEQTVTRKGELVKGATEDETSQKEMAPWEKEQINNPFKTPPNHLTNKGDEHVGMGEKG
ncbi:hypothetical protein SAMN02745133_02507 [Desulforamulus putei DSM 12395]|uniref:Uncharacterized protein n=1 Tax=Desulforamulus putei DSM 12395 TaxID=1121429 RepID=A0A1M5B8X6_9FIRM|nr:hypothetical protein [Desulforamulus putei]SHF38767.1 hypothetical protein SAMN02745133_02507 [Desulforamulus putei DSM 12395]